MPCSAINRRSRICRSSFPIRKTSRPKDPVHDNAFWSKHLSVSERRCRSIQMNRRLLTPPLSMGLSIRLHSARNVWLVLLTVAWVMAGLVGHDPWKPDEAYTFGIVHELNEDGNWAVPSL